MKRLRDTPVLAELVVGTKPLYIPQVGVHPTRRLLLDDHGKVLAVGSPPTLDVDGRQRQHGVAALCNEHRSAERKDCARMPKRTRDAIEHEEKIFNCLEQSHISAKSTARLRTLIASSNP